MTDFERLIVKVLTLLGEKIKTPNKYKPEYEIKQKVVIFNSRDAFQCAIRMDNYKKDVEEIFSGLMNSGVIIGYFDYDEGTNGEMLANVKDYDLEPASYGVQYDDQFFVKLDKYIKKFDTTGSLIKKSDAAKLNLPLNAKWEDITIRFIDAHRITVLIGGEEFKISCEDMGCMDKRTNQPNKRWDALTLLSLNNGEINIELLSNQEKKKFEKRKQEVSSMLKKNLGLKNEPFFNCRNSKLYKLKCKILPEAEIREQDFLDNNIYDDDSLGIKVSYSEQAKGLWD